MVSGLGLCFVWLIFVFLQADDREWTPLWRTVVKPKLFGRFGSAEIISVVLIVAVIYLVHEDQHGTCGSASGQELLHALVVVASLTLLRDVLKRTICGAYDSCKRKRHTDLTGCMPLILNSNNAVAIVSIDNAHKKEVEYRYSSDIGQ